jgi:hypothetical protein
MRLSWQVAVVDPANLDQFACSEQTSFVVTSSKWYVKNQFAQISYQPLSTCKWRCIKFCRFVISYCTFVFSICLLAPLSCCLGRHTPRSSSCLPWKCCSSVKMLLAAGSRQKSIAFCSGPAFVTAPCTKKPAHATMASRPFFSSFTCKTRDGQSDASKRRIASPTMIASPNKCAAALCSNSVVPSVPQSLPDPWQSQMDQTADHLHRRSPDPPCGCAHCL